MSGHQDLGEKIKRIEYSIRSCSNMDELRRDIDQLDRLIIELLSVRQGFMEQAAHIKDNRNDVRDEDRIQDVVDKVIIHANKVGCDPDMVEKLYRDMIEWSIIFEMKIFDSLK